MAPLHSHPTAGFAFLSYCLFIFETLGCLQTHFVNQSSLKLIEICLQPLSAGTEGLCHHAQLLHIVYGHSVLYIGLP